MWMPYILSAAMVYVLVVATLKTIDEAEANQYNSWVKKEGPLTLKQFGSSVTLSVLLVYCLKYEFSAHVTMVGATIMMVIEWVLSWKRRKLYCKSGALAASTALLGVVVWITVHFWEYPV